MAPAADITALLLAWTDGEELARGALVEAVYAELRRVAQRHLRKERPGHSLTPSALVHEAYLKVIDQRRVRWQNRAHFFAIAGHVMRRILVDHARARATAKRGDGATIALDGVEIGTAPSTSICWRSTPPSTSSGAWTRVRVGWSNCVSSQASR